MRHLILVFSLAIFPSFANGSEPIRPMTGAELSTAIDKLTVLKSALYIAAHPDDENTAMISWLANEELARTGYLSLTRGSGGQNLIGDEVGPALGVIRTWELLRARGIDGGEQFFTRAIDFGYSKSPEETMSVWNRSEILSDVIRVVRKFRPDVIITRFPADGRGTHGHHTASAILASEGARFAGDPLAFPEQIDELDLWTPKRLFWNAWQIEPDDNSVVIETPLGGYDPVRGLSWGELSALSRSMHKSQGFGVSGRRSSFTNDLLFTDGIAPDRSIFSGIDTTWNRIPGGQPLQAIFERISSGFNPRDPEASLHPLLEAWDMVSALEPDRWRDQKLAELENVIRSACGLWAEVTTDDGTMLPGSNVGAHILAVNRSAADIKLIRAESVWGGVDLDADLQSGEAIEANLPLSIPSDAALTQPYWLAHEPKTGTYDIRDDSMIGEPIAGATNPVALTFSIEGRQMSFDTPLVQRVTDRVRGEVYIPTVVTPRITLSMSSNLLVLPSSRSTASVEVTARNHGAALSGTLRLELPEGWSSSPVSREMRLDAGGAASATFAIMGPDHPESAEARAVFESGDLSWDIASQTVAYDHIPATTIFTPATAKLVRVNVRKSGSRVGYVNGSGDTVDDALKLIGYEVVPIEPQDLASTDLSDLDALVFGIRAFNTTPSLTENFDKVNAWVRGGGIVLAQYNTSGRTETLIPTPVPIQLSRDRVTVEQAPVRMIDPRLAILNTPNKIANSDFDGWVQERGLYFPDQWGDGWKPVLGMADPGEDETTGSLLMLEHGEGVWIYTGLSLFRELPAGVPGAYRLLANLVSGGRE